MDPCAIMQEIDSYPPAWRALVYEYGFQIVHALILEGTTLAEAQATLPEWRTRKQEELLNERFIGTIRPRPLGSLRR